MKNRQKSGLIIIVLLLLAAGFGITDIVYAQSDLLET